jgi:hypothetical protein
MNVADDGVGIILHKQERGERWRLLCVMSVRRIGEQKTHDLPKRKKIIHTALSQRILAFRVTKKQEGKVFPAWSCYLGGEEVQTITSSNQLRMVFAARLGKN